MTTLYDPQRHSAKPTDYTQAWADVAEDEPEEDNDHVPEDESPEPHEDEEKPPVDEEEKEPHPWPSDDSSYSEEDATSSTSGDTDDEDEEDNESEDKSSNTSNDSRHHAVCKVKVPGLGSISYLIDDNTGYFLAKCTSEEHSANTADGPCQITKRANAGPRAGQGRPLGFLMAWLERQQPDNPMYTPTRDGHVRPNEPFKPVHMTRTAARDRLMALPGATELAKYELGGLDHEPKEPIEVR